MIHLEAVTKTYDTPAGAFHALRGIDLDIARGELAGIVGKSGSGKSTLLNMLGGIDRPSSGRVLIDDRAIERLRTSELARWRGRSVGFVFQFFQLLPTLTALENITLPMDFLGALPAKQRRTRAMEFLDRVGVLAQKDKLPNALSGGEQQRVAIARALANDPPLLLADEPTGNLDSTNGAAVFALFRELANEGRTIIVVTHERDAPVDRVISIADGRMA
ncbi:MAG: ABC transporter ATP-binding protein [Thermoanaerobaculia bacterium]